MTVRLDAPRRALWPERVAYTNGMLLDSGDFDAEQTYHRGRLALLTRYLHGTGTVAGLEVTIDTEDVPMLVIGPGLAIDRVGRVIESPLPLCMEIGSWYEDRLADPDNALEQSFRAGSGEIPDHVLADVFIGFRECEVAKRPAFQRGDFDALGSVAPLRVRDSAEARLVVRTEVDPPLPNDGVPEVSGSGAARRRNLDEQKRQQGWIEDVWWAGVDGGLEPDVEHPADDTLYADIFLARVMLPATADSPPQLNPDIVPTADNTGRRMVYSAADLVALAR